MTIKVKQPEDGKVSVTDVGNLLPKLITTISNKNLDRIIETIKNSTIQKEDKLNLVALCEYLIMKESDIQIEYEQ